MSWYNPLLLAVFPTDTLQISYGLITVPQSQIVCALTHSTLLCIVNGSDDCGVPVNTGNCWVAVVTGCDEDSELLRSIITGKTDWSVNPIILGDQITSDL